MGFIGSFGPLVYIVSHERVLTYSELEETVKGRWANHEPLNNLVLSEFLGPGQDEKTVKMIFSRVLGTSPDASFARLRSLARSGEHFPIIHAGVPLGNTDWYIDSITSTSTVFLPADGSVQWRECEVKVKEYH